MRRFLSFLVLFAFAPGSSATAAAYPWPIKPFETQHPIRANFGDPRTLFFNTMLTDGLQGPGSFRFHNGIDIMAAAGTPVYPVVSGRVHSLDGSAISVRTVDNRVFQYYHLVLKVRAGDDVVAGKTVLGYVTRAYQHVHLSEIRGMRVWNPLAPGGIAPYSDHTVPKVDAIDVRPAGSLVPFASESVCGRVSLVATARDTTPLPVPGLFARFPVSPALLTWSLARIGGKMYVRDVPVADFRTTLPLKRDFWNVYARGSYQNAARFSNRQYFTPGRFLYNLAHFVDTRTYPNGLYEVSVEVSDMRGNQSEAALQFKIANHPRTEDGCSSQP